MRILAVLLGFSVLAGCAGVYKESAVPGAMAAYNVNLDGCKQRIAETGLDVFLKCVLDTDRQFAADISLNRMDLFDAYAARMGIFSQDVMAGRVQGQDIPDRFHAIRRDYHQTVHQAAAIDAEQRARIGAALAAMGQGMQREADRQAYVNANDRSFTCTSTAFVGTVRTRCN